MALPQYLAELPSLSDVISKIEEVMTQDENRSYGDWMGQPRFPDENKDAWTQKQWFRYELFMKAGREGSKGSPFLPTPEQKDKDLPPSVAEDEHPFSPLSMIAALDLCGYKQKPITPDDIRLLCDALQAAAKSDLEGMFSIPTGLLSHILEYSIYHQDDCEPVRRRCYGGAKAADALRDAIIDKIHALCYDSCHNSPRKTYKVARRCAEMRGHGRTCAEVRGVARVCAAVPHPRGIKGAIQC